MIINLIFSFFIVAGVALLWRNFRYDTDNPLHKTLESLPYILRKPITCGLCVTFWIALMYTILFAPGAFIHIPTRMEFPFFLQEILKFLSEWMIVGVGSALVVYITDTFVQISHYYAHRAHERDDGYHR